jgi:hypothetical protein
MSSWSRKVNQLPLSFKSFQFASLLPGRNPLASRATGVVVLLLAAAVLLGVAAAAREERVVDIWLDVYRREGSELMVSDCLLGKKSKIALGCFEETLMIVVGVDRRQVLIASVTIGGECY